MTDERRDRLRFLRTRVEGRPEAARDWFGYAARCMRDRLGFWRFRLIKRTAAAWDWILWVSGGPMWAIKRRAKERAIARQAGLRPERAAALIAALKPRAPRERVVRPAGTRRRAVLVASAGALAVAIAVGATTIDFTSGPDDEHVATAGTSFVANMQPVVGERGATAAERAHERRARAHRARVAAQRRHRAAVAHAKRLKLARAHARRVAATHKKQVASAGPAPSASTPAPPPQPVAPTPAPVPVRSAPAPAPAPAPKPAPKPQGGVVFDDER